MKEKLSEKHTHPHTHKLTETAAFNLQKQLLSDSKRQRERRGALSAVVFVVLETGLYQSVSFWRGRLYCLNKIETSNIQTIADPLTVSSASALFGVPFLTVVLSSLPLSQQTL